MSAAPLTRPISRTWRQTCTVAIAVGAVFATGVTLTPASAATPLTPGSVVLTEVSWTNWSGPTDADGDHQDWVELTAPGAAVDLSRAGLSDKENSAFRWRFPAGTTIPAGGRLVVALSGKDRVLGGVPHTSFDIGAGDSVFLTAPGGPLLDSVATPEAGKRDISWCRAGAAALASPWAYCPKPTPAAANTGTSSPTLLAAPVLSVTGGVFSSPVSVTASGPAGATIRYTLDGGEPTASSTVWTGALSVRSSKSVRAASFAPGALSSPVTTQSYVIGAADVTQRAGQRVVLITMSPADQLAHGLGVKDRKFASAVQILGPDGTTLAAADAETDVPGQIGSLASPQKGFDVSFRSAMGTSSIKAQLIPDRPTTTYRRFRLRNGGNDTLGTRLRDAAAQGITYGGPNLSGGFVPASVYLNGKYYGELELREREDETLVESYTGADKDSVDFLTDPLLPAQAVNNGQDALATYKEMNTFVTQTDMSNAAAYAKALTMLDPVSLSDDWVLHLWAKNIDWPSRNVHVWRSPALDGRWHWQPHDFDTSFGSWPISPGQALRNISIDNSFKDNGGKLITALLRNPQFRTTFLNTAADALNSRLLTSRTTAVLDQQAAALAPFIGQHHSRWPLSSLTTGAWKSNVAEQRAFLVSRNAAFDAELRTKFTLSARQPLTVSVSSPSAGSVKVNSLDLSSLITPASPTWTGSYYPEVPVTLTATPMPGQVFLRWEGAISSTNRTISGSVTQAATVRAVFGPAPAPAVPVLAAPASRADHVGDVVRLVLAGSDPSGLPVTYSAKKLPSGVDLDAATGVIYGRLTKPEADEVSLTVSNGVTTTKATFTWSVTDAA
jgi:CotH kinase protein/Chitobiase/beta-hexosaminidase C-terminal domain/Putative Ig domain